MTTLTQKQKILAMLRTAGPRGINSFGVARRIALQLPVRIKELKEEGFLITTRTYKNRSKDYILVSEPAVTKKREKPAVAMEWNFSKDGRAWQEPVKGPQQEVLL